jgi:hypothetical protein
LNSFQSLGIAPFAGYSTFNVKGVVSIPQSVNFDEFRTHLDQIEDEVGLNIEVVPFGAEEDDDE